MWNDVCYGLWRRNTIASRKMFRKSCLFVIFLTCFRYSFAFEVSIEQGTLIGGTFSSRNGRPFYGFTSIPFAKPPVGDLRFEAAQLPEPWSGVRNATQPSPRCLQKDPFLWYSDKLDVEGDEDCLYLDVYTPAKTTNNLIPVMVYIHGGAFIVGGSGFYDPMYFMDYDVVVVAIQYRLNTLGFLSTADDVLPGNVGFKDQVMALKWVQKNIAAFGGNPNRVTIFGESAGAGCVHLHMHSTLSKGLFHQAISQSGSALALWAWMPAELARERTFTVGKLTGCPTASSRELVACLKKVPGRELALAYHKLFVWDTEPVVLFRAVSEPSTVPDAFLRENPWHQDEVNKVPLITGLVSEEGIVKSGRFLHNNGEKARYINDHYKHILPISLFYSEFVESKEKIDHITESIKKFYFSDKDISMETSTELTNLYTDNYFAYDVLETVKRRKNTTFVYYYQHKNEHSLGPAFGQVEKDLGVSHADELISLFHLRNFAPKVTKGDDFEVSKRMVKYWVNFATNGNPDPDGAVWTPVESDAVQYLHITTKKDQMKTDLLKERYEFWKSLSITPPRESTISSNSKDEL